MSGNGFEAALTVSPLATLVRGVIEWAFPGRSWSRLHEDVAAGHQMRKLCIDSVCALMVQVVAGSRRSVFAAFQADQTRPTPTIAASYQALYGKLKRMPPEFSCALVRESAQRLGPLLQQAGHQHLPGWKGYRIRMVDGTQPNGSEHRLEVLRRIRAAGLPCRVVAVFDPAMRLCVDVAAAEDAYTSEQVMVAPLLDRAQSKDLYVADRHFAVAGLFLRLHDRQAHFVIREHLPQLILAELCRARRIGRIETGVAWDQAVEVTDGQTERQLVLRRIIVRLDEPTENGETEIRLLTNLPRRVSASKIARLYRQRWSIERHFDLLKNSLHGQVESLGQPRAAIFVLCMSMVAGNALAVVQGAIRAIHGDEETKKLSGFYLADEIAGNYRAIDALIPRLQFERLSKQRPPHFWKWCLRVARDIRPRAFYAHPRGPKHPPPKRASGKHRHHYSTYRLLQEAKKRC